MHKRELTSQEKDLLRRMALLADPSARPGLTIWFCPDQPPEHRACYVPCIPASGKPWQDDVTCTKPDLDALRDFADFLESSGALRCVGRKTKESGEYYAEYESLVPGFDNAYRRLDPDGFEETLRIIDTMTRQQESGRVRK